jgi:hypothetical protein
MGHDQRKAMPDLNPFDMDSDGDVDGVDFLGFDYFMRHVQGRAAGSEEGRADTSLDIESLIGVAVLLVTIVFACLVFILTMSSAS